MADLSPSTQTNIEQARTVMGIAPTEPMVPYRSIAALLEAQADRLEDKPFLVFYPDEGNRRELSYREFTEEAMRTAMVLLGLGVRAGDRVATMSPNHSDLVLQYFAVWLIGACVVPINVEEDDRRITFMLQDSGARVLIVRDRALPRVQALRPTLPKVEHVLQAGGKATPAVPHLATEILRQPARLKVPRAPRLDDEALLVYTSGTTGDPKGILLDQYNLLADAMAIAEWHQVSETENMMCVLPLHHVNGIVVTVMTPLYGGATAVLNQAFHPDRFFERISAERVAIASVVPTTLQFLLHAKLDMAAYKLANFRHLICGAGPLTIDLATKFEHAFKMPVVHGYGLSETTCYNSFLPIDLAPAEHRSWMTRHGFPSIGVPLSINEMSIHDEQGNALDEGVRGEIVIRGHSVMRRYWGNPEANDAAFTHGWFRSGDQGFFLFDDQGRKFFFITGRLKELIIRGGENISPFEVDEILTHMPGIAGGIAVGFENDWYGEEVGALVRPHSGSLVTEQDVVAYCRKHLPFAKSPKVVVFTNDLPLTSTGKHQRTLCRERFAPWKETQFAE